MALGFKMLELEKRRTRAAKKEFGEENYVPDFVDVMIDAPVDDGKVLEDSTLSGKPWNFSLMEPKHLQRRCAELVLYPTLMNRTREEIDGVVGLDRLVEESDFSKLPYLQAIVKETFRLHQSPLGLPRESTAPGEALGYKIPTKTRIIFNIHAIHRDPAVYDNPDEFHPDRFLREHVHVNHMSAFDSYELIPFGVGRRMCPA